MNPDFRGEAGAIPFVVIGLGALAGTLGLAWAGSDWAAGLLHEAGGELTVWVLRGAFWSLDLVALQASTEPVNADWYTPVLEGPALPLLTLAALVMVATLLAEVIAGMIQGNSTRIVQAVLRAVVAGMLATVGAALLLSIGGALSEIGRAALDASGTTVDAPLVPLQEVLMETAQESDEGAAELFIAFLAALVIVFTCLSIYFLLAMRPVLLAAIIVFLPLAHAVSVWTPMRRVQIRVWSLAFAVLVADAAILTMFAVANTAMGQPEGVDRLIFGTFGLLLAALSPAALARVVGAPELHTAVQSMSRGSKMLAIGAGVGALKAGQASAGRAMAAHRAGAAAGGGSSSALDAAGVGAGPSGGGPGGPAPGGSDPDGGSGPAGSGSSGPGADDGGASQSGGGGSDPWASPQPGSAASRQTPAGASGSAGARSGGGQVAAAATSSTSSAAGPAGAATSRGGAGLSDQSRGGAPAPAAASSSALGETVHTATTAAASAAAGARSASRHVTVAGRAANPPAATTAASPAPGGSGWQSALIRSTEGRSEGV